jgi:phospholipid/cholesterol/gamma-HCH transport system substrate-binding protein
METRARFALIGLFTIAVVLAGFAFVYWIQNTGGIGQRTAYRVRFEGSVSGLLVGSSVLFNGMRVGEVASLELDPKEPRIVMATVAVDPSTPVRVDTTVGMDFQGLTGSPVVVLSGGNSDAQAPSSTDGQPPLLVAAENAGQTLTQSARNTLRHVDDIFSENAEPLHKAIENINTFTEVLSRNSKRIDGILAGLERMTGGSSGASPTPIYVLKVPPDLEKCSETADVQIVVPEPDALIGFSTTKIPVSGTPPDPYPFGNAQLADTVPALVHAKTIEALENSNCFRSVTRNIDGIESDFQVAITIRNFSISTASQPVANLDLAARVISSAGRNIATTIFHNQSPVKSMDAEGAIAALNDAFEAMIRKIVPWLSSATAKREKLSRDPMAP